MNYIGCFLNALVLVFFAEMGDKTQFMVMAFSSRYRYRDIIAGVAIAVALLNLIAVFAGGFISQFIPDDAVKLCAGLLFLVFALLSFLPESNGTVKTKAASLHPVFAVSGAFFLAELGDKTQVTTMTLAAQGGGKAFLSVFLGSSVAMLAANCVGLLFCLLLGKCLPEYVFRIISIAIFTIFGFITIYEPLGTYAGADLRVRALLVIMAIYAGIAAVILLFKHKRGL